MGNIIFVSGYATGSQSLTLHWTWQADLSVCNEVDVPLMAAAIQPPPDTYWYEWNTGAALPGPIGCGYGPGQIRLHVTDNLNQTATSAIHFLLQLPPP